MDLILLQDNIYLHHHLLLLKHNLRNNPVTGVHYHCTQAMQDTAKVCMPLVGTAEQKDMSKLHVAS